MRRSPSRVMAPRLPTVTMTVCTPMRLMAMMASRAVCSSLMVMPVSFAASPSLGMRMSVFSSSSAGSGVSAGCGDERGDRCLELHEHHGGVLYDGGRVGDVRGREEVIGSAVHDDSVLAAAVDGDERHARGPEGGLCDVGDIDALAFELRYRAVAVGVVAQFGDEGHLCA